MNSIFVDTSGFVAVQDKNDRNHKTAIEYWRRLAGEAIAVYTSNYVFDETYTVLLKRVGREAALDFGEAVLMSKAIQMVYIDEGLHELSWKIARKYADKALSFTDCTSFAVINDLAIDQAFSYDSHFRQFGQIQIRP